MERLKDIQDILDVLKQHCETLTGDQLCVYQTKLSVYLSYVSDRIIESEKEYYEQWVKVRDTCETDGQATNRAKTTQQYFVRRFWELEYKNSTYQINSLKKHLSRLEIEKQVSKYL